LQVVKAPLAFLLLQLSLMASVRIIKRLSYAAAVLLQILFLGAILLDKQKKSDLIQLQRLYHLFKT